MNDSRGSSTAGLVLAFLAGALSGAVARAATGKAFRVPPALNEACLRAAGAARAAFIEAFGPPALDKDAPPGRGWH